MYVCAKIHILITVEYREWVNFSVSLLEPYTNIQIHHKISSEKSQIEKEREQERKKKGEGFKKSSQQK